VLRRQSAAVNTLLLLLLLGNYWQNSLPLMQGPDVSRKHLQQAVDAQHSVQPV
jgi:hypothetical protein